MERELATEVEAPEFEVVKDGPPPARTGRPLRLTPRRFIRICRWI
jgi:hypothetical protein